MGIAQEWTEKWREENDVPDSDDVEYARAELVSGQVVQKRGRAQSTAEIAERRRKTIKRT